MLPVILLYYKLYSVINVYFSIWICYYSNMIDNCVSLQCYSEFVWWMLWMCLYFELYCCIACCRVWLYIYHSMWTCLYSIMVINSILLQSISNLFSFLLISCHFYMDIQFRFSFSLISCRFYKWHDISISISSCLAIILHVVQRFNLYAFFQYLFSYVA